MLRGDDCSKSVPCKRLWHAKSTRERRRLGEKHEHRRHDREEVTAKTRVASTAVTKAKEKAKPKQEGNSRQCLRTASTFPFLGPTGEVLGSAMSTRGHVQETNWLANTTEEEGTHRHPGTRNRAQQRTGERISSSRVNSRQAVRFFRTLQIQRSHTEKHPSPEITFSAALCLGCAEFLNAQDNTTKK